MAAFCTSFFLPPTAISSRRLTRGGGGQWKGSVVRTTTGVICLLFAGSEHSRRHTHVFLMSSSALPFPLLCLSPQARRPLCPPVWNAKNTVSLSFLPAPCRAVWFAVRPELLLTADEAAAILSDVGTAQPPTDAVTAAEACAADQSGATAIMAAKEEESRRETEALAVLLSEPAGGSGVPGGAAAQSALTRLAARYLVRETVRGKIPDPVGNFHVRE